MNKFALVGKGIAHSRSPEMYRKIISHPFKYDLLDYQKESDIPTAKDLLSKYDGINITSPYKRLFINEVELTPNARELGAINCLKKEGDKIIGENTDYPAIIDILTQLLKDYGPLEVIVLGDGVMSFVAQRALEKLSLNYKVLSRKQTKTFDQLNLEEYFFDKNAKSLIINTCAREYVFRGKLPSQALFWDFNYNFPEHQQTLPSKVQLYFDGIDMLERQAFYAVAFWSKHCST